MDFVSRVSENAVTESAFVLRVGDASVPGAKETCAAAGDGGGDIAQGGGQPRVAFDAALVLLLAGRLVGLRAELGPRHQMRG